ncbi:hypothetical protein BO221_26940 [Archangium sp. Cb G35]|uniref:nSTAND3 domain-containing NTPase n=1 Tax=Archangium sp. Cb G35 TaxID=1920190 RepID=UPI000935BA90|nr:HEAT repeat domain-containing protein [Archangium sp. Cb G35]OJT21457.1 hypothetical protein BO221_26940 [Archangium sp. Cb G35]
MTSSDDSTGRVDTPEAPAAETGATRSYQGFEYQLDVSVWVVLEAFFGALREMTECVEIEPDSEEDLELILHPVTARQLPIETAPPRIFIQIKRRSTKAWSAASFGAILRDRMLSGGQRWSLWEQLSTHREDRYLLITDAMVNSELRPLCVPTLRAQAPEASLPQALLVPSGIDRGLLGGKIEILEKFVDEIVSGRIRKLLSQALFVPSTKVDECATLLRKRVRDRLMNRLPRSLTREELQRDVAQFGGRLFRSPELQAFVPPASYAEIKARLAHKHVLVLRGQPGVGKTLVAHALKHEHQTEEDPFEVIRPQTPEQLEEGLLRDGRIFFEVVDPFGYFEKRPEARHWYGKLPQLLELASTDKKIVITTRDSLLHQLGEKEMADKWFQRHAVTLAYDDYAQPARRQILYNKLVKASPWQRELVSAYEERILGELRAPLSIHRFAKRVEEAKTVEEFRLEEMLKNSAVDQLADHFLNELKALDWDAVPAAIGLWGLLALSLSFSQEELDDWSHMLRKQLPRSNPILLNKLVQWMSAGSWMLQDEEHYRVHPTTQEGLARLVHAEKEQAQDVLEALLTGLASAGHSKDAFTLASVVPDPKRTVPAPCWSAIRDHFRMQLLTAAEKDFAELFDVTQALLTEDEPVSLLVAGITRSRDRSPTRWYRLGSFHPPEWTEEQQSRVTASSDAREIARRYIRWRLPSDGHSCSGALASWLWGIGWDLSSDFLEAVNTGLRSPDFGLGEAVHGALMAQALDHEQLLEALLRASDEQDLKDQAQSAVLRRARQEMLSPLDADIVTEASREQYGITEALDAAVSERRHQQGYGWLLQHPRRKKLLYGWVHALVEQMPQHPIFLNLERMEDKSEQWKKISRKRVQPVTLEELRALFEVCLADTPHVLWSFFERTHAVELRPELLALLWTGPARHLEKCLDALRWMSTSEGFREQMATKSAQGTNSRRAEILFQSQCQELGHKKFPELGQNFRTLLHETIPCPAPLAFAACKEVEETGEPAAETLKVLGTMDRQAMRAWSHEADSRLGRSALVVLAALGEEVGAAILAALQSKNEEHREAAIRALRCRSDPSARALLRRSLEDEHYKCRVLAIQGLAAQADAQERQAILALTQDGSAPVKEACVDAIREGVWAEGLDVLYSLLGDSRNREYGWSDENVDHHVARAAAKALQSYEVLPDRILVGLIEFVRKGLDANVDVDVHTQLLDLLVPLRLPELPSVLTDLLKRLGSTPSSRVLTRPASMEPSAINPNALKFRIRVMLGLVKHILRHPGVGESVDMAPILSVATHPQETLAAMAWVVLGFLGERAWSECRLLLEGAQEHREEKATFLVLGAARVGKPTRAGPASAVLAHDATAWQIAEWLREPRLRTAAEWREQWDQTPKVYEWVKELHEGSKWRQRIYAWLQWWFGAPLQESLS